MESMIEQFPPVDDDMAIERFSEANPQWRIEIDTAGAYSLSPTHTEGGAMDFAAGLQLSRFAERHGGRVFGSASGYRLPDGSLRAPDASWMSDEHIARLSTREKTGYWRTCPDIVIEILSASDKWSDLIAKIDSYERNGAVYVVAIDPFRNVVQTRGIAPLDFEIDVAAIINA